MAKRRATRIQEYVDAMRDLTALENQKKDDPVRFKAGRWFTDYIEAKRIVQVLRRELYGGEIGKAHAMLARPAVSLDSLPE